LLTRFVNSQDVDAVRQINGAPLGGVAVTIYSEIVAPPFETGALNATVAAPLRTTADKLRGAPGTVKGVTVGTVIGVAVTEEDSVPSPALVTARSLIETDTPFVKPLITKGDVVLTGFLVCHGPSLIWYL
jgi:hypothetical protein